MAGGFVLSPPSPTQKQRHSSALRRSLPLYSGQGPLFPSSPFPRKIHPSFFSSLAASILNSLPSSLFVSAKNRPTSHPIRKSCRPSQDLSAPSRRPCPQLRCSSLTISCPRPREILFNHPTNQANGRVFATLLPASILTLYNSSDPHLFLFLTISTSQDHHNHPTNASTISVSVDIIRVDRLSII